MLCTGLIIAPALCGCLVVVRRRTSAGLAVAGCIGSPVTTAWLGTYRLCSPGGPYRTIAVSLHSIGPFYSTGTIASYLPLCGVGRTVSYLSLGGGIGITSIAPLRS